MKIDQAFVDAAVSSLKEMLTQAMQDDADVRVDINRGVRAVSNPSQFQWKEWEYSGDDSVRISFRRLPAAHHTLSSPAQPPRIGRLFCKACERVDGDCTCLDGPDLIRLEEEA